MSIHEKMSSLEVGKEYSFTTRSFNTLLVRPRNDGKYDVKNERTGEVLRGTTIKYQKYSGYQVACAQTGYESSSILSVTEKGLAPAKPEYTKKAKEDITYAPVGVYKTSKGNVGVLSKENGKIVLKDAHSGQEIASGESAVVIDGKVNIMSKGQVARQISVADYAPYDQNKLSAILDSTKSRTPYKEVIERNIAKAGQDFETIAKNLQSWSPGLGAKL